MWKKSKIKAKIKITFCIFELFTSSKIPEITMQVGKFVTHSMHHLEIDEIKYISLSSVIARKLNFQKHIPKNNAISVMPLLSQSSDTYIFYRYPRRINLSFFFHKCNRMKVVDSSGDGAFQK